MPDHTRLHCAVAAQVLLISSKSRSTSLYKGLSARFSKQLTFGEARDSDEALKESLGVDESPQLLILPSADKDFKPIPYTGQLTEPLLGRRVWELTDSTHCHAE